LNCQPEKYLVLRGCAGLGNRLFTFLYALQFAKLTGRTLVVDWRDGQFNFPGKDAFGHAFTLDGLRPIDGFDSHGLTVYPNREFLKGNGIYDVADYKFGSTGKFNFLFTDIIKGRFSRWVSSWQLKSDRNSLLVAPFRNSFMELGERIHLNRSEDVVVFTAFFPSISKIKGFDSLRLNRVMLAKVNDFINAHNLKEKTMGVHVRYSDKKPTKELLGLKVALEERLSNFDQLFLSTDSNYVESEIKTWFPNKVIVQPKTQLSDSAIGLHQSAYINQKHSLTVALFEESIVDMWSLSACTALFYQGNSSFSLISHHLKDDKSLSFNWLELC
jgi:hypothetical protein